MLQGNFFVPTTLKDGVSVVEDHCREAIQRRHRRFEYIGLSQSAGGFAAKTVETAQLGDKVTSAAACGRNAVTLDTIPTRRYSAPARK